MSWVIAMRGVLRVWGYGWGRVVKLYQGVVKRMGYEMGMRWGGVERMGC